MYLINVCVCDVCVCSFLLTKRDPRGFFWQFVFPVLYILILLFIVRNIPTESSESPPPLNLSALGQVFAGSNMPYASSDAVLQATTTTFLNGLLAPIPMSLNLSVVSTEHELQEWLLIPRAENLHAALFTTSLSNVSSNLNAAMLIMSNASAPHAAPMVLNMISARLLSDVIKNKKIEIQTTNHPFPYQQDFSLRHLVSFLIAFMTGLSYAYIPVVYAVVVVKEKQTKAKHQQLVMGTRHSVYWLGSLCSDMICFLFCVVLTFIFFAMFGEEVLFSYRFPAAIVLFLLYGLCSIAFTYMVSFLFEKPQTVQAALSMVYGLGGIMLFFLSSALKAKSGMYTHINTYMHKHTCTHMRTHTHTHTQLSRTHTHTTQAHTHTHNSHTQFTHTTHTHTTHTHIHTTLSLSLSLSLTHTHTHTGSALVYLFSILPTYALMEGMFQLSVEQLISTELFITRTTADVFAMDVLGVCACVFVCVCSVCVCVRVVCVYVCVCVCVCVYV